MERKVVVQRAKSLLFILEPYQIGKILLKQHSTGSAYDHQLKNKHHKYSAEILSGLLLVPKLYPQNSNRDSGVLHNQVVCYTMEGEHRIDIK